MKRLFDVLVSACGIVLLAPFFPFIALAIRLDSKGPVFFRQVRVGRGGRTFRILKFRTMVDGADAMKRHLGPRNEADGLFKITDDPRCTTVGRLLRRTCLDELPQCWNVLIGDMSLVGPRPELPEIVARYEPWQHLRHAVVPGITGWWQVNRTPGALMHETTHLDLYYVEHWSLALDAEILLRTIGIVLRGVGAF